MKKTKKFLSVLCAVCMILVTAAPAFATSTPMPCDSTDSVSHTLNSGSPTDRVNWSGSSSYCYWKIAIQNKSDAMIRVHLYKNGTTDELIRTMVVPANDSKEFFTDTEDFDQILTDARYHLVIESDGGKINLNGTLWYRFATTSGITRSATSTTTVSLNCNDTQKIFDFPVARGYGYWKIAIRNKSSADCWFSITKDSPNGETVYTSDNVPANGSLPFRAGSNDPLPDGSYYVTVHSTKMDINLNGTLWYKFGTSYEDIAD